MNTQHESTVPRLLVIDDEPGICLAISLLLQDFYEVVTAETAAEGLTRLSESYDLILLDLHIPGVSRYELLENVCCKAQGTPVAILSAAADRRTHDEVCEHGAVALIEKPFSRKELLTRIQEILATDGTRSHS